MDIYRFFNSKDVAEHLRATGYELNAYEAAYFVERCEDATLAEKVAAWNEIARTMPDCPTAWDHNYERRESTHAFLHEYVDLQERMLEAFEDGEGFVYFASKMRRAKWPEWLMGDGKDLWTEDRPRPFSTLGKCVDHLRAEREDGEFDRYVISRAKVDCPEDGCWAYNDELVLDGEFRPMEVDIVGLEGADGEARWSLHNAFIEQPVPFAYGDIVISRADRSPHPFVFDHLKFWDSAEIAEHGHKELPPDWAAKLDRRVAHCDEKHSWDDSHMVACGYELGGDYTGGPLDDPCDLCSDVFGACSNYLDLERYDGPLDGELKLLEVASLLMKDEIDFGLAANLVRLNELEARAGRLRSRYDAEYVEWVRKLY